MSLTIETILCRAGTMDNYSYLLIDNDTKISAIVDPSEAKPIIKCCQKLNIRPDYILTTHHHFDHTDANLELKSLYGSKIVGALYDAHRIKGIDMSVEDDDTFMLGKSQAEITRIDGHTIGHILWYFPEDKALFTGDTLFNLCIGGIFEGTPLQMFQSLSKIRGFPDDTLFYPGHEYTKHGIEFALHYDSGNSDLQQYIANAQSRLNQGLPTGPVTLGVEKKCNPYLKASTLSELERLLNL